MSWLTHRYRIAGRSRRRWYVFITVIGTWNPMTLAWRHLGALLLLTTVSLVEVAHGQLPVPRPLVPGAPKGITAFVDVTVIPMDTERVLLSHTVLVKDGWIMMLGPSVQVPVPAGATRIDGRGKYLIPGLADMHVHTSSPQDLFQYLAHGVTTVRAMDGSEPILQLRAQAAAGTLWSPRLYVGKQVTKPSPRGGLDSAVAAIKREGYDFIKIYYKRVATEAQFNVLMTAARRVGLPVAGHVPFGVSVEQAVAGGMASIEHLTGYTDQHNFLPIDAAKIPAWVGATKRASVWNCPTMAVYRAVFEGDPMLLLPAGARRDSMVARNTILISQYHQMIKALHDSGAGLLLGVDANSLFGSPDDLKPGSGSHRELEEFVAAGLTPYQALVTGTRNIAQYFGTLDSTGTIAAAKRADLVLLDANPLADIKNSPKVAGVMIGGRWLARAEIDHRLAGGKAASGTQP